MTKAFWQLTMLLALVISGSATGSARVAEEQALKAAYLYNFAKFVEWPGHAEGEPLRLCVYGMERLGAPFEKIRGRTAHSRPIDVALVTGEAPSGVRCEILFISREAGEAADVGVIDLLAGQPVLTVSDIEGFSNRGGMIEFRNVGEHIKFVVNIGASRDANLIISAFLLQLALEVQGGRP